jgi:hypothetical protein
VAGLGLLLSLLNGFYGGMQFERKLSNQARCHIIANDGDRLEDASWRFQPSPEQQLPGFRTKTIYKKKPVPLTWRTDGTHKENL